MKKTSKKFSFLGLTVTEEHDFSSRITTAATLSSYDWQPGGINDADLIILTPQTALTQVLLNRAKENGRPALLFLSADAAVYQGWPCLTKDTDPNALTSLLNLGTPPSADADSVFHSLTELSSRFKALHQSGSAGALLTSYDHACILLLDLQSRIFYVQASPHAMAAAGDENIWRYLIEVFAPGGNIHALAYETIKQEAVAQQPLALERWLWQLGMHMHASLLPGIPPDALYRLERWPDFGALHTRSIYIRLTSALVKKSLTAEQIGRHFPLKAADVTAFLNACYLCDHLRWRQPIVAQALPSEPTATTTLNQSIDRLRHAIGIEN